ncbi:MAG: TetR/AcrR family transcriptional regulator [Chloroflexota bacterium]
MKTEKNDRRSNRTRELLSTALVELMLEKRYDSITIQDILDRADIGRSTFYAHYTDKEDLLMSELTRLMHTLQVYGTELGHVHGGLLPSLEFFRHVQQQRRLMRAFVTERGGEILLRDFQVQMSRLVEQNLRSQAGDNSTLAVPLSVVGNFVASTFLMLLRWWFEEDMKQSPEQMDAMFQKLVMPSIHVLIEAKS